MLFIRFPDPRRSRNSRIWCRPLFDIDSLAGVTLVTLIGQEFGVNVELSDLLELRSFEAVSQFLRKHNHYRGTARMSGWREESFLQGSINRLFQLLARILPGGGTLRIQLHRARGVHIWKNVFISEDVILETGALI